MKSLKTFLQEQNIQPKAIELYELAFTHTSVNVESKGIGKDYERLEFIGDAFLSMVSPILCFAFIRSGYKANWVKLEPNSCKLKISLKLQND